MVCYKEAKEVRQMLKCPKCEATEEAYFSGDPRIKDMADLSREKRKAGRIAVIKCSGCGYEGDPLEFDPRSALPKVANCYITTEGMVIAFDADDQQIPECQGFILAVASELKIRCDGNTVWGFGRYGGWLKRADFGWWFLE